MAGKKGTHYETLGVGKDATAAEIKKAFRSKAKDCHPDTGGDSDDFKAINEANEVLSDPTKRADYDLTLEGPRHTSTPWQGNGRGFGGPHGAARQDSEVSSSWLGDFDLFDIYSNDEYNFGDVFGRGSGRPAGMSATASVSFVQALSGIAMSLSDGSSIQVPPGVYDGMSLRFKNRPGGDVTVRFSVLPLPPWGRDGADITVDVPVTPKEAALGTDLTLSPPGGGRIRVKIPAGTQTGKRLKFKGKGAGRVGGEGNGDLVATVGIVIPKRLSEDEKDAWRGLPDTGGDLRAGIS